MDIRIARAINKVIKDFWSIITGLEDLRTKIRIYLADNYFLDIYFNATLKKYSYVLIKNEKRILGWDNAPHHKNIKTFPHHFHTRDREVTDSNLTGSPETDLIIVMKIVREFLQK